MARHAAPLIVTAENNAIGRPHSMQFFPALNHLATGHIYCCSLAPCGSPVAPGILGTTGTLSCSASEAGVAGGLPLRPVSVTSAQRVSTLPSGQW